MKLLKRNKMELDDLREKIDEADEELLNIISERLSLMPKIATIKQSQNISINQEIREKEVIEKIRKKAVQRDLNPDFIEKIIIEIILESKKIQQKNMEKI
ncbi:MAG: chorismate mutase [Candidatus Aenigmarchaeota archaeon]|nr:chorismate mutase [Candidatus Aenigmarchaeota archaeon]